MSRATAQVSPATRTRMARTGEARWTWCGAGSPAISVKFRRKVALRAATSEPASRCGARDEAELRAPLGPLGRPGEPMTRARTWLVVASACAVVVSVLCYRIGSSAELPMPREGDPGGLFVASPVAPDARLVGVVDHARCHRKDDDCPLRVRWANGWSAPIVTPINDNSDDTAWQVADGSPIYAVADGEVIAKRSTRHRGCGVESVTLVLRTCDVSACYRVRYKLMGGAVVSHGDRLSAGDLVGHFTAMDCGSLRWPLSTVAMEVRLEDGTCEKDADRCGIILDPFGWRGAGPDPLGGNGAPLWDPRVEVPHQLGFGPLEVLAWTWARPPLRKWFGPWHDDAE